MSSDFRDMTVTEMRKGLLEKSFSSVELTKHFLGVIEKKNTNINAFIEVFQDTLKQAEVADKKLHGKDASMLTGIPIAMKDNILIEGKIASAGSKILEKYIAAYSATVTKKLQDEGTVFLGRTNMDEFAMGSSTEHSAFGVTKNPHDQTRVPGGSSGGSAAAVAMGGAPLALGSDTGGSIRQPAAFCGCVGFKPTYGAVSRYGLIAMGSSLDQIGPFAKTSEDAEILFEAIKGYDPMDSTSLPKESYEVGIKKSSQTIGVPRNFLKEGIDPDILKRFEETLTALKKEGHTIKDIDLPNVQHALASYYILMPAEASTNLSRFDGVRYGLHKDGENGIDDYFESRGAGFGSEVRRRILLGTYVLSAGYYDTFYGSATAARAVITRDFETAFKDVDVIATPTTTTPAFKIGEKSDPLSMYLSDIFTVPANITGQPALSLPMGTVDREGTILPVSLQLTAPHMHEKRLFTLGSLIEKLP